MKKTMKVINNPRLDRIFTEAYSNTMKQVALREQNKHDADYYSVFSELFEKELYNRDLTAEERSDFMTVFHREVERLQTEHVASQTKRRKFLVVGGSSVASAALLAFGIYVAAARPFMPVSKVVSELDYRLQKVEEGFGSYSRKFYRLLDQQQSKLPSGAAADYRATMYEVLDTKFDETVALLEAGEVRYYDDAKQWASRFPEKGEQEDRKEIAENAFKKGLGTAVGDTLDDVKEGARNLFQKAVDFVRETVERNE